MTQVDTVVPRRTAVRRQDRPIGDYGLIGDMRGAALVATDGSIDWLCLARFDAVPTFAALLDADRGGRCSIAFDAEVTATDRHYVEGTNVLETRFAFADAAVVVTDFMPVRRATDVSPVGSDSEAPQRLVRIVRCERGRIGLSMRVDARFDWGRRRVLPTATANAASYHGERLHVVSSAPLDTDGDTVTADIVLEAGAASTLVIAHGAEIDLDTAAHAERQLRETLDYWRAWSSQSDYRGAHAAFALRSALCLKLMTYAPTGGMVAAPTMGLPEVVGGVRNWDYRYVWTRDASFSVSAFLNLGFQREGAEFLRFLHQACDGGEAVRVLYAIDGELPEVEALTHLPGWRSSRPVNLGNDAGDQDQFEIYGELLAALCLYVERYGLDGLCPELVADLPAFVHRLADAAMDQWRSPDQGIWELKGDARHMVHTKAMCWIALDRAITLAGKLRFEVPARWRSERDLVRDDCLSRGWDADRQAFTMEYGGAALDMAFLRLPLLAFIDPQDPRVTTTLRALEDQLGHGDLYRRYRMDDELPGEEGAFLACSFWMVGVLLQRGDLHRAAPLLESLLDRGTDLGLFAEQMDVTSGDHLGNFPQAFTHMTVIHEILRLDEALRHPGEPDDGEATSAGQGA